ncbi:hypothetical protein DMJ13_22440 [halophilic archaeon]|nr:hypothetical protein DMJ13_22440 [halophilic archaeon]
MTNTPPTETTRTRRQLLAAGTSFGIATTAGCLGILGDSKPIKEVTYKPFQMRISLRSDAEISKLSFIAPDGTSLGTKKVASGQTTVDIPFGRGNGLDYKPLSPGKYKIVVEKDGKQKQSKTVKLTRSATIQDVAIKYDREKVMEKRLAEGLTFAVKNTGILPIRLTKFRALKGLFPQKKTGIGLTRKNSENFSQTRREIIVAGQTARFKTGYSPLTLPTDRVKGNASKKEASKRLCTGKPRAAAFELKGTNGFREQHKFNITYTGKAVKVGSVPSVEYGCQNASIRTNNSQSNS